MLRGVRCYYKLGGATCEKCPTGLVGDGRTCTQDGCLTNPCAAGTKYIFISDFPKKLSFFFLLGVKCTPENTYPFYKCAECPTGTTGNGTACNDIDECLTTVCGVNSDCTNIIGSFRCTCINGYEWSAGKCTKMEGMCLFNEDCDRNAECMLTGTNKFKCKCKVGWAGNGFICGTDTDVDGWPDNKLNCTEAECNQDNCAEIPNSGQEDINANGIGDVCDSDADSDGKPNDMDNCPLVPNPNQSDTDADGKGDACDNCPTVVNLDQADIDEDGTGDKCDDDIDNDGNKHLFFSFFFLICKM